MLWHRTALTRVEDHLWLLLANLSATFIVTWHAHFFLLLLVVPLWVVLERMGYVKGGLHAAWWLLPLLVYLAGDWIKLRRIQSIPIVNSSLIILSGRNCSRSAAAYRKRVVTLRSGSVEKLC